MQTPETSLLEINGEDDTLLHHLSTDDVSAFAFSPLHSSTSHLSSGTKHLAGGRALNSSSAHSNKENLTTIDNKSETHNLNVERQKMKKSKKAGGYNLRKSLAWDKAFFTEEGVLDPVELSMISGISFGDRLSAVAEEQRDSETITSFVDSGSADDETIEDSSVKDMSFSQPSNKNTSTPVRKRDSLLGSRLPMISRSIQKVPTAQGVHKSAIKGTLCSTPKTSTQKRLLNTGTLKVTTRNSKIPRVPLSKHPPLPSTTNIHAPSSGNHLKCPGSSQQAQKYASKGINTSAGGTSISIKQLGASTRMDTACSSVKTNSLANHKAQSTNRISNYLHNSSKQCLPVKSAESVDGTSRIRNLFNPQSDKGDGNKKDVQVQGIKPSGLRMPSPSMRFFSEDSMKSSNLKSSIPVAKISKAADHISDFKQIKVRHGSLLQNATLKKRMNSQVTEICSTSSLVDPTAHADVTRGNCNQKVLQQQVLLGDKVPQATNDVKCTKNVLNNIDSQHGHESVSSLNARGKDVKYDVISFHAESMNISSSDPVVQQNDYAGRNTNSSIASCPELPEVQLTVAFASNGDVSQALDQDMRCSSSAMNDCELIRSETDLNSHQNNWTLVDRDSLTNMIYDDETPGTNKIDDLRQSNVGKSMNPQLDGSKLLADGKCRLEIDENDSAGPVRVGETVVKIYDGIQQGSISSSERMSSCSTKSGVVGGVVYEHVDKEQGDVMNDSELSTMKLGECSAQQDNISNNHVPYHKNCDFFSENRSSSITSKRCGNKDNSDVGTISNHSRTSFLDLSNNGAAQFLDLPLSLQGAEESPLCCGYEKVEIGRQHASSISYNYGTELAVDRNIDISQQVVSDDLVGKLPLVKRDTLDVNKDLLLINSSPEKDRGESNFQVSNDIFQMHSSVDGVEAQIDSASKNSAFQTTDVEARLSASTKNDQATSAAVDPINEATNFLDVRHDLPARELMSETLDVQSNKLDGSTCLEEPETNMFKLVDDLTVESECIMEGVDSSNDDNVNFKRTIDNLKVTVPATLAVPFSDEWLAAIISAGEEILTMKTGAVQHSPPDKSAPDPSPWSPVKRKTNQVIGPFDCTKCTKQTNTQLDHSD
ncbi:hypothetical protein vseg_015188 [Gypsophila vaccaria]